MGFALSILYFVTYYLTPTMIFGPLAAYHVELIIAALALLVSLPTLAKSFVLRTPQALALVGLGVAALLSVVIGEHWAGGGVQAFLLFIPNAFAYFLVCLHCNSKKRLQLLVLMMLLVCLWVIAQGYIELQQTSPAADAIRTTDTPDLAAGDTDISPYIQGMRNDSNEWFYRIRGLGEIHDPNDFGQLIVCVLPLVFFFWRPRSALRNVAFVILPVGALLFGVFLTHSRGATTALVAMAVVAIRRRIGILPALVIAGGLFFAASALHFTGGRDISVSAGEDRTALWGAGLELLKSHPLFGVGFGEMPDYAGLTAHNSLVVCAAELGSFGLYFWSLFLFPTVRDVLVMASPAKVSEGEPIASPEAPFPHTPFNIETVSAADVCRLGQLLLLSLTGFLVAGWFLSRSFVMTFFLLGGIVEVVFQVALERGMISPRLPLARVLRYSGGLAIGLIMLMYLILRIVNVMH